ncbi:MAG TPA: sigma 54-interacting transcriptional regulator, partial [Kofleriaceae bacterium]
RIPFFAPVAASGLSQCWATNLSPGGIGLTGLVAGKTIPQPGDDLELEFGLLDGPRPIRAVARVAWASRLRPDGRLGLGAQFRELSAQATEALGRFLTAHRPRVVIARASVEQQTEVARALADLDLAMVDDVEQLSAATLRAAASIVVFTDCEVHLTQFLDAIAAVRADADPLPGELPPPPVTLCTQIELGKLAALFNKGRIYEALPTPFDHQQLVLAVERSCERWALQVEVRWASLQLESLTTPKPRSKTPTDPELPNHSNNVVRASAPMKRVYELISTVAVHDVPVLLTGETGTGKELAAREIHVLSKRANTPFVAQDCGALTETLLESELFGHVKGAFTGATTDHPGLFQIADGGTIFLDEIQNTSPTLQAKLLRVVEQGEVRPVGGPKPKRVDVRLIAACNVDLKQAVKEQRFRSDFYYRLNRFPIELPPLREHADDILPLTRYFVQSICEALRRPLYRVDPRMERALLAHDWPGNIRELKNAIERSILLTKPGEPLRWETLPTDVRGDDSAAGAYDAANGRSLDEQVAAFERKIIQLALERNNNVIRRTAKDLDVNAITLARKIKRLGLAVNLDSAD